MITAGEVLSIEKDKLKETAAQLKPEDLPQLVEWLSVKEDDLRYQALLLLQYRSQVTEDVYPYWDIFCNKLKNSNSYQRSIGLLLLADNARWDKEHKLDDVIADYLVLVQDEKPITVRQCIQSLSKIIPYARHLSKVIAEKLMSVDILSIRETMRKSILMDIITQLLLIRKELSDNTIENYIMAALTGEILDKKAKKQIEAML